MLLPLSAAATGVLAVITYSLPDPVAFEIGPVQVRWYGLAYAAGLLLGWLYIRHLVSTPRLWAGNPPLTPDQTDTLLLVTALGVVIGGRLGFVLFYKPDYYFANPGEIYQLWKGGMAFHGGLVGTGIALFIYARMTGAKFLSIFDLAAAATPLGLFFGRIANFINGEVYGRPTEMPWGVVFPAEVLMRNPDGTLRHAEVARHPSQLYEALLEGVVLFLVIRWMTHSRDALHYPGYATGYFLTGYALARIFCEFFREFLPERFFTLGPYFTQGMVYSLPMLAIGIFLLWTSKFRAQSDALSAAKR